MAEGNASKMGTPPLGQEFDLSSKLFAPPQSGQTGSHCKKADNSKSSRPRGPASQERSAEHLKLVWKLPNLGSSGPESGIQSEHSHRSSSDQALEETPPGEGGSQQRDSFNELAQAMTVMSKNMALFMQQTAERDQMSQAETEHSVADSRTGCRPKRKSEHDLLADLMAASEESPGTSMDDQIAELVNDGYAEGNANDDNDEPQDMDQDSEDADILHDIALDYDLADETAAPIPDNLAKLVGSCLTNKLSDDKLKQVLDKYQRPQNVEGLTLTKINPEIWSKLKPEARSRDIKMQKLQQKISKATTALTQLTDRMLKDKKEKKSANWAQYIKVTMDAVSLLGSAIVDINQRHRDLIKPSLNARFRQICSAEIPVSKLLFGEDLAKVVKDLNETNRLSMQMAQAGYSREPYNKFARRVFLGRGRGRGQRSNYYQPHFRGNRGSQNNNNNRKKYGGGQQKWQEK